MSKVDDSAHSDVPVAVSRRLLTTGRFGSFGQPLRAAPVIGRVFARTSRSRTSLSHATAQLPARTPRMGQEREPTRGSAYAGGSRL
jgi:hypothetical protein